MTYNKVDEIDPIESNKNGRVIEDAIQLRNDGEMCLVAEVDDPIGYETTQYRKFLPIISDWGKCYNNLSDDGGKIEYSRK